MKHVIAFDVSMGKSTMVIYNEECQCQYEGEVIHNLSSFQELGEIIEELTIQDQETFGILIMSLLAIAAPATPAEAYYCYPAGYNQPVYCFDESDIISDPGKPPSLPGS